MNFWKKLFARKNKQPIKGSQGNYGIIKNPVVFGDSCVEDTIFVEMALNGVSTDLNDPYDFNQTDSIDDSPDDSSGDSSCSSFSDD